MNPTPVPQVVNLLYRRLAVGPADLHPAPQQTANLRYRK